MANALSGSFTNFPNGLTSLGVPVLPGSVPAPFTGKFYFVQEPANTSSGTAPANGGSGTVQSPFTNLDTALSACVSGNNDVIVLIGTTHRTSTLVWNKNNTHLIGACSPLMRGKRARISSTGTTAFTPLVSVTGNGCLFQNIATFYGFNDASTQICWSDTGGRNTYDLVEFLGFGNDTAGAQAGSRTFVLNTSTGETTWRSCTFGTDTAVRSAANYTLEIAGGAPRCTIDGCVFEAYLTGSGANGSHLLVGAAGIDRYMNITNSIFGASTGSGGSSAFTQAFNINAAAGGNIRCVNTWFSGCTNVETSASGRVFMGMATAASADSGLLIVNAP